MTGWRVGYLCAPAAILEGIVKVHQYGIMSAPTIAQDAALAALLRRRAGRRADGAPSTTGAGGCSSTGSTRSACATFEPRGAFYAFPRDQLATGLTSEEFTERLLLEERVAVVPGSAFGPSGEGHVRMCYATAYEQLEEALAADRPLRRAARADLSRGPAGRPTRRALIGPIVGAADATAESRSRTVHEVGRVIAAYATLSRRGTAAHRLWRVADRRRDMARLRRRPRGARPDGPRRR